MDHSSRDMILFVDSISRKLCNVVPAYQKRVDRKLPQPERLKEMIKAHQSVSARYNSGDFRHESREFGLLAELAQYLVNLHAATNNTPARQLTIIEANMVVRQRTMG
jgi:hypothetical protein